MTKEKERAAGYPVKELPYAHGALAPHISEETMRYHHDLHYAGYVARVNELTAGTPFAGRPLGELVTGADGVLLNQAAQAWNHEFYFEALAPDPSREPSGALAEAVVRDFGSADALRGAMTRAAVALFGSGWVWLAADAGGGLVIRSESNAGNPMREGLVPLLCIDVWEHAYYIDHRNRRADAVAAFWHLVDWERVGRRYAAAR